MQIELMAIEIVLRRWLEMPDAPICEISPAYGEKRNRPYTEAEIRKMRDFLKRNAFWIYIGIFYNDGPRVLPGFKPLYLRRSGE
jgi:hypothetical protein